MLIIEGSKIPGKPLTNYHAENILARNGAINAAVRRVHPVVTEEEELILAAHDELFLHFPAGIGRRAVGKVRLIEFGAIDVNRAVFDEYRIAADSNDSFNRKALGRGITYDNDVFPRRRTEMINPTIQQVMIGIVKRRQHARTDDLDRLD